MPDAPGAAESTTDDSNAAIKVRVNGTWYARYIGNLEGRNNVWVPVYIDIEKLNGNSENYFNFGSNVISHGNYTDSSIDLAQPRNHCVNDRYSKPSGTLPEGLTYAAHISIAGFMQYTFFWFSFSRSCCRDSPKRWK